MIKISNIEKSPPYDVFIDFYEKAFAKSTPNIEAILIASLNKKSQEVEARFVNLKYIQNNSWIFFTNYKSPKAKQFESHNQISAVFYWNSINIQIRIKATIKKVDNALSDSHFMRRSIEKNSLAISSNQSKKIISYNQIKENYKNVIHNKKLEQTRPSYWGGFAFVPYYFEFWEGHETRINKREVFEFIDEEWKNFYLEP